MKILISEQQLKEITNVNRLCFFDFDQTLMDVPDPKKGRKKWKQTMNKKFPHEDWFQSPESLNMDIFDIQPKPEIQKAYEVRKNTPGTKCFLLTKRVPQLESTVKEILNYYNITMDEYYFRQEGKEKPDIIIEESENYPGLETIEVWDDREKELVRLRDLKQTFQQVEFILHEVT